MRSSIIKGVTVEGTRDYRAPEDFGDDFSGDVSREDAQDSQSPFFGVDDEDLSADFEGHGTDDNGSSEDTADLEDDLLRGQDAHPGLFTKNTEALERLAAEAKEREEKAAEEEARLVAQEERLKGEREAVERLKEEGREELAALRKELFVEIAESREKAKKEAREEGYSNGYEEGKKNSLDEFEDVIGDARRELARAREEVKKASEYLKDARRRARETVAASERTIVDLAMAVADKLLRKQLLIAPETVVHIVRDTVKSLPDGEHIRVFVNTEDLDVCLANQEKLEEEFIKIRPHFKNIEFHGEEELTRGSCRVESESGVVEFLLDEEKEALREEMTALARKEERSILESGDTEEEPVVNEEDKKGESREAKDKAGDGEVKEEAPAEGKDVVADA